MTGPNDRILPPGGLGPKQQPIYIGVDLSSKPDQTAAQIVLTREALAALPEVQDIVRQAVEAEREALQQARDTNRRLQRRMQLLEGWWQRRVERADKWRKVWQRIYCTDVLDVRALTEADYQRGYEDGLHDRIKIPTQRRVAAIRKRGEG